MTSGEMHRVAAAWLLQLYSVVNILCLKCAAKMEVLQALPELYGIPNSLSSVV